MTDAYLSYGALHAINGLSLVETAHATEQCEDWSACRSPSRARRREKRGFKQRVRRWRKPACYQTGDTIFIHPDLAREMRRRMSRQIDNDIAATMMNGAVGLKLSRLGYRFTP